MESKMFGCCSFKSWATFVGWMHIALYGLIMSGFIATLSIVLISGHNQVGWSTDSIVIIWTLLGVYILSSIFGIILGVILLNGIQKEAVASLFMWLTIEALFTVLIVAETIVGAVIGDESAVVQLLLIILNMFSMYVVHKHRQEILQLTLIPSRIAIVESIKIQDENQEPNN